ncbi:hypothetical protein ABRY23_08355 [Melioribacteraceae bacterium 4301-Me]|uniref:WD40/YVTN/BNR-like repeat-containing protein n=1 Tax=Pyranulibacter aquaticus TaxID=3163344 RepID=UPI003595BDE0
MKKCLLIFLLFNVLNLTAQSLPHSYFLSPERSYKIEDLTPASNTIEKILIVDNTIWLATSNGLSKSVDNGNTWINYYNSKDFGTESVSTVANDNGTIWAATWHFEVINGQNLPVGTGLRYSTDQGETWTKIDQPVDSPGDSIITYGINKIRALPITTTVQNFIRDIAFTPNTVWITTNAGGLRKSTDTGKTWQRIILPPDYLDSIKPTDTLHFSLQPVAGSFGNEANLNHIGFSILTLSDGTIYVGTAGGINKSTDGGISWIKFNHTNQKQPISGNHILAIKFNKADSSIWAATWKAEGESEYWAVSRTIDGGSSWNTFLPGSYALDFGFKYYGDINKPINADVLVATEDGLFRTNNNGLTWIAAPQIVDDVTKISLNTNHFRTVKTNRRGDGSTDIWIGSLNGLAKLNETNGIWSGTWKVYIASGESLQQNSSIAFPNPFSPDDEKLNIKYTLSQDADVTIRIFDYGMNLVRTIIQNVPKRANIDNIEIWDGRDEKGRIVANGVYFYRIDAGNKPLFGKIIVMM